MIMSQPFSRLGHSTKFLCSVHWLPIEDVALCGLLKLTRHLVEWLIRPCLLRQIHTLSFQVIVSTIKGTSYNKKVEVFICLLSELRCGRSHSIYLPTLDHWHIYCYQYQAHSPWMISQTLCNLVEQSVEDTQLYCDRNLVQIPMALTDKW